MRNYAQMTLSHPFPRIVQNLSVKNDPFPTLSRDNVTFGNDPFPPFPKIHAHFDPFPPFPKRGKGSTDKNAHDPFPISPLSRGGMGRGGVV